MTNKSFASLKSMHVLYVEDDPATREELALMLKPWVAELHVAVDGQAGLDLFMEKQQDIVVTDIQMPRLSGLAMSAEIRRVAPDQPIIVLSAYNDVEFLFRAIELGIDQYITKPINVERLLEKLAKMADVIAALDQKELNHVLLEQYKHLLDQSAIICKIDPSGQITYVNEKLCEISHFSSHDLIGHDIGILRHEHDSESCYQDILKKVKAGSKWSGIVRNRKRNGDLFVVESNMVPILNERDEVIEIISLDVDITHVYENYENLINELSDSHLSLKEQRHFLSEYKRALELGTSICVTDRKFTILSVNKQFESVLGYSADELQGYPLDRITSDLSQEHCLKEVRPIGQESITNRVIRFTRRDGEDVHFLVGWVGVHNLAGEIDSIILICQDISESMRLNQDIVETQRELLYVMGDVVESRSQETADHVRRVAEVAKFLAQKAGLNAEVAEMIESAAPMHDIGKVGIRDAILNKQGKLTVEEYEEMKNHARIGYQILSKVQRPLIALAAQIAHQHHERWDGQGYPYGLKGEEISIAGRVVAISDVLDALSSPRCYKPAWDEQRVHEYFREQRGKQFDPNLIDLLLAHWDTIKSLRSS